MAEVQIKKMGVKHEAILEYLLANPTAKMRDVAAYFEVGQAWLSTVIHSDVFQQRLKDRSDELFVSTVLPLREKLLGLAHVGVDKLGEVMEHASPTTEKQFIADTTDQILKSLGFTPKAQEASVQQNNIYLGVSPEDLAQARNNMEKYHNQSREVIDGETLPAPEGVQNTEQSGESMVESVPAQLCDYSSQEGSES